MSGSTNRWRTYENISLALSLFILLIATCILILLTVGSALPDRQPTSDAALKPTLEAIAGKTDEAIAAAQTAVAKAEALESRVGAVVTPSNPISSSAQAAIAVDGGVALTYQAVDQSQGKVFYRVDCLFVYGSYGEFKQDLANIPCVSHQTTIQLALVKTQQGSDQYHLFYHEAGRPVDDPQATFNLWSEYALIAELHPAQAGGQASMTADQLTLYEDLAQTIITSTGLVTNTTIETSVDTFELALERPGLSSALTDKLLLADNSDGKTIYTLVVLDPDTPAGGDRRLYWCRVSCWRGGCRWVCR